jgi:dTDP-glucose 4,6-dehydratase
MRYAINPEKIEKNLGWSPTYNFEEGIKVTVKWYLENTQWWEKILSGEYSQYFEKMYSGR